MTIKVSIRKDIADKVDQFPSDLKKRIKDTLKDLERDWPMTRLDIKKLKGYNNHYRIRVGNYRILFFRETGEARVYDISIRSNAYK